jgi:protein SCO1/2
MRAKRQINMLTALAALVMLSLPVDAQTPAKPTRAEEISAAEKYFTNTELLTQNGKTVRFYTDVLKGKVVVINCFFATCPGSCIPMNRNFEKIQALLGDKLGKEVFLVSITVDPEIDTPAVLKKYATTLNARPGWIFLTGQKTNVDLVQKKLGQYVVDKNSHQNILIIGNVRTGLWKKAFGLAKPEEIAKIIESVVSDNLKGTP